MVEILKRKTAPALAYQQFEGDSNNITIVFMGGFRSDMQGTKACFLDQYCRSKNISFIRFDYRGHGQSEGDFEQCCLSDWLEDVKDILTMCKNGKVLLIGSSMGGWLAMLAAIENPKNIFAFVGLAAAPDFTSWIESGMSADQRAELNQKSYFYLPSDYDGEPYIITQKLLEDGRKHCLLEGKIDLDIPVRLIQGMKDKDVEWQTAHRIKNAITGQDVEVILMQNGDHRLSAPADLQSLAITLDRLLGF